MKSVLKIGRDKNNDIEINEPRVSRFHALITHIGNDAFEIKDLNSTNGTFVNGNRISSLVIKSTDRVEVAGCMVKWFEEFSKPVVNSTDTPLQEEPFSKIVKTISIGSAPESDIQVNNEYISRNHARISLLRNGDYYVQNLDSTNGTFVNGASVASKNFLKTDVLKIGSSELPANWFLHPGLQKRFFRDHIRTWIFLLILLFTVSGGLVYYFFSCQLLGCNCDLSDQKIAEKNRSAIVFISHSFYYTLRFEGKLYYIGKNKIFKVTEANLSRENLLPFDTVSGNGCFVSTDGSILTTIDIANPWLNKAKQSLMVLEVLSSKTINKFSLNKTFEICGYTAELRWLTCGRVDNRQNYIEAETPIICEFPDTMTALIRSVKLELPQNSEFLSRSHYYTDKDSVPETGEYYFSNLYFNPSKRILLDTVYKKSVRFDMKNMKQAKLNRELSGLTDGSPVLDTRGDLVGLIRKDNVLFIHRKF
jgi:pSer/pThr/pTyr-binding forkhead associated (FHA) protein